MSDFDKIALEIERLLDEADAYYRERGEREAIRARVFPRPGLRLPPTFKSE
jgi:hypothetical protein